jgi:hypothetical protein
VGTGTLHACSFSRIRSCAGRDDRSSPPPRFDCSIVLTAPAIHHRSQYSALRDRGAQPFRVAAEMHHYFGTPARSSRLDGRRQCSGRTGTLVCQIRGWEEAGGDGDGAGSGLTYSARLVTAPDLPDSARGTGFVSRELDGLLESSRRAYPQARQPLTAR